jgi:hypothetical protein
MKRYLLLPLLLIFIAINITAQENDNFQTVFSSGIHRISGFGGPIYNYTTVNGDFTLMTGGGGGVLLNDFFLGGYGMANTTGINCKINGIDKELSFTHGGIWIGYSHHAKRAIHPAFFLQTGWGKIKVPSSRGSSTYDINDRIFVINPEIEVEINIARFFRISLGANYRIVGGLDSNSLNFTQASGPGVNLMFKFGWF